MVARRSRFIRRDDWNASWIWCEGESRPRNFYLYARKSFKLSAKPSRAQLRITADSRYKLFVNGTFVGRGPVRSYPGKQSFDTHDIADYLSKGNNVIAVLVHHIGHGTYSYIAGRAGLICEVDIEMDGKTEQILTDNTWKVMRAEAWTNAGDQMNRRIGYQEVYDARLEPQDWTEAKFKDAKWPQATVIGKSSIRPFDRLVARQIPHLKESLVFPTAIVSLNNLPDQAQNVKPSDFADFMANEELKPLENGKVSKPERLLIEKDDATIIYVPTSEGISIVLDFGREVFGCLDIAISRANDGTIDIGYSEALEDGRVMPNKGDIKYTDRLILRKSKQAWCSFEPRAFRYLQLDFRNCSKPISLNHVFVRESTYPVEWKGDFECSDELLNQIWKTGAETARLCMEDTYIDSPWRERAQWWDNVSVAAKVAYYAFGDNTLFAQALKHIAQSQRRDGAVFALYPSSADDQFPDFGARWVMSVWDYYIQSGDKRLLTTLYPAVVRWLRWIEKYIDDEGLLNNVEGNTFIDWAEIDRRGAIVALNCLCLGALRATARMAQALHKNDEAENWEKAALSLKGAIDRHFWSAKRGLYADAIVEGKLQEHFSKQSNVLAALHNIPDHYQKSSIFRKVLTDDSLQPIDTPQFMSILVEALCTSGEYADALNLIRNEWGPMISEGATTFWEFFTQEGSLCYAASTAPTYQLQAHFLGIMPTEDTRVVHIEPHPAGLEWAKGAVYTSLGIVAVEWNAGRKSFAMVVEVPKGMQAEIVAPKNGTFTRVLVNNRDVHEAKVKVGPGIHRIQLLKESSNQLRRRLESSRKTVEKQPLPIPPGRGDIEAVTQMIQILAELDKELAEMTAAEELAAEETARKRRRPRRKSGKGKQAQGSAVTETAEVAVEEAESAAEPAVTEKPTERRTSRRRRGRKSPLIQEPTVEVEVQTAEIATEQPEEAAQVAETPSKKSHKRSHRRRRKPSTTETEVVSIETPVAEEKPAVSEVEKTEAPSKSRRRPHRRRRPVAAAAEVSETTEVRQPQVEAQPIVVTEKVESEQAEKPAQRPRRKPSVRRKPSEKVETSNALPVAEQKPAEAPIFAETKAEEPVQKPKPQRRRRTTKQKESETVETIIVEKVQPVETSTEAPKAEEKKPRRRSTRRKTKPTAQDDTAGSETKEE